MKLFTIGDSISQGLMSGSTDHTDCCYSTLIAQCMGLNTGDHNVGGVTYFYPEWKKGGLPANLEKVMRTLNQRYGSRLTGVEWLTVLKTINSVIDESEDYYERGNGKETLKYHGNVPYFNNVSVWSFEVADAWLVTPELCRGEIKRRRYSSGDGWMTIANASMYRTALKVLDPNLDKNFSQLDWLRHHAHGEGVENLLLWLGANNAFISILILKLKETVNNPLNRPHSMTRRQRRRYRWNLWHPEDFAAEYDELLERVDFIQANNRCPDWKVFVGTVPLVAATPLLKGAGKKTEIPGKGAYYDYYTHVYLKDKPRSQPSESRKTRKRAVRLERDEAIRLDDYIRQYNQFILQAVKKKNAWHQKVNKREPYHIVDTCDLLTRITTRDEAGKPLYRFPEAFDSLTVPIDGSYYDVDRYGKFLQGGVFSLDGVHPSHIGQGLLAHEFIKVMKKAGVSFKKPLNWEKIFKSDSLLQQPISMMQQIYSHDKLAQIMIKLIQCIV